MRVEIINKEELVDLYKNHGLFACTCYDTPDKYAEKVGKSCNKDGHMSGSRTEYIKFRIYDIDRGTAEQLMRHEIGTDYDSSITYSYQDKMDMIIDVNPCNIVKNMQSFRYVDKNDFTYVIPNNIKKNEKALALYQSCMNDIEYTRKAIRDILIEEDDVKPNKAVEDANFVLPRATNTKLTIGFTPEALIRFEWKRLCRRSQDEIREIAIAIKNAVNEINPNFAKELMPHCQHLLWCPEKHGCGAYPTKKELKEKIEVYKLQNDRINDVAISKEESINAKCKD